MLGLKHNPAVESDEGGFVAAQGRGQPRLIEDETRRAMILVVRHDEIKFGLDRTARTKRLERKT